MKALDINGLEKTYPTGVEALKGVDLEIEEGEFFGLLGPNGAGKSTLIHCTSGLAQPTAGSIRVFGHDAIGHYTEARLAVGLAPQANPAGTRVLLGTAPCSANVLPITISGVSAMNTISRTTEGSASLAAANAVTAAT